MLSNTTVSNDPRTLANGFEIPSEGYCDQPYIVKTQDNAWLCVMTTGRGHEGQHGQHIVATRSFDLGKRWSPSVDIEPADGPEASWVMPYITRYGRIYAFYTYNSKNIRGVLFGNGETCNRVDTLGEYAFKYSDDGGRNWSARRGSIPVRETEIDRRNPYGGTIRFFWGVGKPICCGDSLYLGFSKVGKFGEGFMEISEGWFLRCGNIETERDTEKLHWETLPDGETGLCSPGAGTVCDEANLTVLSDGTLFATCRTTEGHPVEAWSRDGGHSWTSGYMRYAPDGPLVCNPRGPNFVRKLESGPYAGKFVYWFYNNQARGYDPGSRNPVWLAGGVEQDSPAGKVLCWGRPEVVLYDMDLHAAIGYPDFIEEGERLFVSETRKTVARVHEIPPWLLDRIFENSMAYAR